MTRGVSRSLGSTTQVIQSGIGTVAVTRHEVSILVSSMHKGISLSLKSIMEIDLEAN